MIALNRSRQIILVSMFSVTVMVAIGAIDHLVSLDASILKPLNVPTLEMGRIEPDLTSEVNKSQVPINPTLAAKQTDRERQNVALAKLQNQEGKECLEKEDFSEDVGNISCHEVNSCSKKSTENFFD